MQDAPALGVQAGRSHTGRGDATADPVLQTQPYGVTTSVAPAHGPIHLPCNRSRELRRSGRTTLRTMVTLTSRAVLSLVLAAI